MAKASTIETLDRLQRAVIDAREHQRQLEQELLPQLDHCDPALAVMLGESLIEADERARRAARAWHSEVSRHRIWGLRFWVELFVGFAIYGPICLVIYFLVSYGLPMGLFWLLDLFLDG